MYPSVRANDAYYIQLCSSHYKLVESLHLWKLRVVVGPAIDQSKLEQLLEEMLFSASNNP